MNSKEHAKYIALFNKLGYHTEKVGSLYFFNVLDEVRNELKNNVEDDEIKAKLPSFYLEDYHFFFEVTKTVYMERINDFLTDRRDVDNDIIKSIEGLDLEDILLVFAKYINEREKAEEQTKKPKSK